MVNNEWNFCKLQNSLYKYIHVYIVNIIVV